jgi:hypothetical protein
MRVPAAVTAVAQGEKIKAGLIWTSESIALLQGLGAVERSGALRVIKGLCAMISHEVSLVRMLTADAAWDEVPPFLDKAVLMIESGVPQEAVIHLSRALSRTTGILGRAVDALAEEG